MDKAEEERVRQASSVLRDEIKNIKNLALQFGNPFYISAASELESLQKSDANNPEIKKKLTDLITKMSR